MAVDHTTIGSLERLSAFIVSQRMRYVQPLRRMKLIRTGGRVTGLPSVIQVGISDLCNFRCIGCAVHGEQVVANENNLEACLFKSSKPMLMDIGLYRDLVADISKNRHQSTTLVFCAKGEPTLNPNFSEMVVMAHEKGLKSSLHTNGSRLTTDILNLCQKCGVNINVSLNACDIDSHKAFSDIKTDYFTRITELVGAYSRANPGGLDISLSFVIGSHNILSISRMASMAGSLLRPGSRVLFYPEWTYPEVKEHNITEEQLRDLLHQMPAIRSDLEKSHISHNLDVLPWVLYGIHLSAEAATPTRQYYQRWPCDTVSWFAVILADGRVVPCCRSCYVLGNVTEESLHDIWHSQRANRFRYEAATINRNKRELPLSHCFSCQHLGNDEYFLKKYSCEVDNMGQDSAIPK